MIKFILLADFWQLTLQYIFTFHGFNFSFSAYSTKFVHAFLHFNPLGGFQNIYIIHNGKKFILTTTARAGLEPAQTFLSIPTCRDVSPISPHGRFVFFVFYLVDALAMRSSMYILLFMDLISRSLRIAQSSSTHFST
jgi:hypothetical protein